MDHFIMLPNRCDEYKDPTFLIWTCVIERLITCHLSTNCRQANVSHLYNLSVTQGVYVCVFISLCLLDSPSHWKLALAYVSFFLRRAGKTTWVVGQRSTPIISTIVQVANGQWTVSGTTCLVKEKPDNVAMDHAWTIELGYMQFGWRWRGAFPFRL